MLPEKDRRIARGLFDLMKKIGSKILAMRARGIATREKIDFQDIVTPADLLSEAMLKGYVEKSFPSDGIRSEEGAHRTSQSHYEWIFDPIDGTTVFAHGLPFFGISAGRTHEERAVLGSLFFPALGEFFFAARGKGAFMRKDDTGLAPIQRFANPKTLKDSVIVLDVSQGRIELVPAFSRACMMALRIGSFVYEAMLVAQGQVAAHINTGPTPFDLAAAMIIAEEAGCVISRLDRKPIDLRDKRIPIVIAANDDILAQVLEICERY